MELKELLNTGSFKALSAIRHLRQDITDELVIKYHDDLLFRNEFPESWKAVMFNIHGVVADPAENSLDVAFWKFVQNVVARELNFMEMAFHDLPMYQFGSCRSILAIAMMLDSNAIRADQSKALLKEIFKSTNIGLDIETVIINSDLLDENSDAMDDIIKEIIAANPMVIAEFNAGKEKVLGSLIGQVMKKQKGNPQEITARIKELINAP